MESSRHQATLGKIVMSIKVTDVAGQRISFGRANGRFFAKWISGMTLFYSPVAGMGRLRMRISSRGCS